MALASHCSSIAACLALILVVYVSLSCSASAGRLAAAQTRAATFQANAVYPAAIAVATNAYEGDAVADEPADGMSVQRQVAAAVDTAINSYEGAMVDAVRDNLKSMQPVLLEPGTSRRDTVPRASHRLVNMVELQAINEITAQQELAATTTPAGSAPQREEVAATKGSQLQSAVHADAVDTNAYEGEIVLNSETTSQTTHAVQESSKQQPQQWKQHETATVLKQFTAAPTADAAATADAATANSYEGEEVSEDSQAGALHQPPAAVVPTKTAVIAVSGHSKQPAQEPITLQQQLQRELLSTAETRTLNSNRLASEAAISPNSYQGETVLDIEAGSAAHPASALDLKTAPLQNHEQQQQRQQEEQQKLEIGGHASQPAAADTAAGTASPLADAEPVPEWVANHLGPSTSNIREPQPPAATEDWQPVRSILAAAAGTHKAALPNMYEGGLAELEAFKPIYSFDDPSTHATQELGQQKPPVPPTSSGASVIKKSGTSIDDMTLGLGPKYPIPGSTQQQQQQQQGARASPALPQHAKGSGDVRGGPNTPGNFLGGPTLTQQHAGWKHDSPNDRDGMEDSAGTYVAASSAAAAVPGTVDKNIFDSLNNDLAFYISLKQSIQISQRRLMSSGQQPEASAADSSAGTPHSVAAEGPMYAVPGPLQYPEGSFDLPAAAGQAAQVQIEALQQVLAAKRVPRVLLEKAAVPDFEPGAFSFAKGAAATDKLGKQNRPERKLIDVSAAATAKIRELSKGDRGEKPLWGVTYSWRRAEACDGERQLCRCPRPEELDTDLDLLYRYSHRIRTYSVECPELMRILLHYMAANPAASWLAGIWIGTDAAANQAQINLLGRLLEEFPHASMAGISVGNEAISRGDVKEPELIEYIQQVRHLLHVIAQKTDTPSLAQVPIMTAEQPAAFTAHLAAAIDAVGAVIQPFYSGAIDASRSSWVKSAVNVALQQYAQLQEEMKGKQVLVAEIGWPSRSGELDTNRASLTHAAEFANAWVKAADKASIPYYYHELVDAGWKAALRQGAASAASAARKLKGRHQQPSILGQGVLGDEHFGLVTADRKTDKGLLRLA